MISRSFPHLHRKIGPTLSLALSLSLGLALAGCGGIASNRGLESVHQPVVERQQYTFDLTAGPGGLSSTEKARLSGWFETLKLRNGDKVSIDDPLASGATHADVENVVGRFGLLVNNDAPVTTGYVNAGTVRVILSRTVATVPHCPDWSDKSDANPMNASSRNYGCAVNSNFASMIADPEHLIKGVTSNGDNTTQSATKAINAYRSAAPSGNGGTVKSTSSKGS